MRIVLYTEDFEPITVLDLSMAAMSRLKDGGRWRFAVPKPFRLLRRMEIVPLMEPVDIVEIWSERFIRKGQETVFLFTRDEEAALMLKSDLLPGQIKDAQAREREQYARGFLRGIAAVLGD